MILAIMLSPYHNSHYTLAISFSSIIIQYLNIFTEVNLKMWIITLHRVMVKLNFSFYIFFSLLFYA